MWICRALWMFSKAALTIFILKNNWRFFLLGLRKRQIRCRIRIWIPTLRIRNATGSMRSHRDVVYLCWPIAPSYISPNPWEEGEGVAGSQPMTTVVQGRPNKLWRSTSNSICNLWLIAMCLCSHAHGVPLIFLYDYQLSAHQVSNCTCCSYWIRVRHPIRHFYLKTAKKKNCTLRSFISY